jgi:antitoxin component YwqK of YwqJK toxin-antitoxin module
VDEASESVASSIDITAFDTIELPNGVTRLLKKDADGQIIEEGYLKNGKKNGVWTTYADERVLTMVSYIDDIKYGKSFELDHRRQITEEATYVNGMLYGKKGSYKFGRPKLEAYYINNQLHGPLKKYFESGADQGKINQLVDYVNGKIDGKVRYYNAAGEVTVEYDYKNGEKISGGIKE